MENKKATRTQLIKNFLRLNRNLFEGAESPLQCHGPEHHLRVCEYALELVDESGVSVDESVLIPACLLHDISACYPEEISDSDHHIGGAEIAKNKLEKIGYPSDKIRRVVAAISGHRTDHMKKATEVPEMTILRDADKIDSFGAVGVARIIMAETRRGRSLEQIADKWVKHIEAKWKSITFIQAKKKAKSDYHFSKNFFEGLKKDLTLNEK